MSYRGTVKSFNDLKGWGFITHEGADIFLHIKDCKDGRPQAGDAVSFDMEEDPVRGGQKKALSVTGCTLPADGGKGKGKGKGGGGGSCQGMVKSFNDMKGWGFVDYQGTDVFVHVKDCVDGRPQAGDWLSFDLEEDPVRGQGQMKACNVAGGTGFAEGGWGWPEGGPWGGCWADAGWGCGFKGKGKGKGPSYGPAWDGGWGGGGGACGPYGKGPGAWKGGGGKDGGYGKGGGWGDAKGFGKGKGGW